MTTAEEGFGPNLARHLISGFALTQFVGFFAALFVVANGPRGFGPWPLVLALGVLLAQIYLASLVAAWGPWPLLGRMGGSLGMVVAGLFVLMGSATWGRVRPSELLVTLTFVLLAWAANQVPLWILKPALGLRILRPDQPSEVPGRPAQFGIRQLMVLTLLVALTLGIGRLIIPVSVWTTHMLASTQDWLLPTVLLAAMTLVGATTAVTALHPRYWLQGIAVSAASSLLVAYGQYSIMAGLKIVGRADRLPFAVMIVTIYVWLQVSLLLVHWSGYRLMTMDRQKPRTGTL